MVGGDGQARLTPNDGYQGEAQGGRSPVLMRYYENSAAPIATLGGEVSFRRDFRQGYTFTVSYAFQRSNFLASDSLSLIGGRRPRSVQGLAGSKSLKRGFFSGRSHFWNNLKLSSSARLALG